MAERFNTTLRKEIVDGVWTPWGKFKQQIRDARGRGIDWELTFEQWCDLWRKSGRWSKRGAKKGCFVMHREGDKGAYKLGNVSIIEAGLNHHIANIGVPRPKTKAWARKHAAFMRGKKHTRAHNKKIGVGVRRAFAEKSLMERRNG